MKTRALTFVSAPLVEHRPPPRARTTAVDDIVEHEEDKRPEAIVLLCRALIGVRDVSSQVGMRETQRETESERYEGLEGREKGRKVRE